MTTNTHLEKIPDEIKEIPQWVAWKHKKVDDEYKKVPVDPHTKENAGTDNPDTWAAFDKAVETFASFKSCKGVGFVFTSRDAYTGVDIDGCIDPETGEIESWAQGWIDCFGAYTEISPSGTGVHIVVKGVTPRDGRKRLGDGRSVEIYSKGRYFTFTGATLDGYPPDIPERQDLIEAFVKEFWADEKRNSNVAVVAAGHQRSSPPLSAGPLRDDEEVIDKARAERNGKFDRLWRGDISEYDNNHSDADDGFVHKIWPYTQDEAQVKRIHAASGLHRPEKSGKRVDYLQRSIRRAQDNVDWFYEWPDGAELHFGTNGKNKSGPKQQKAKAGKDGAPTHDELRDRWLETNPDHAFGLGEWQYYSGGVWSQVSETTVKAQLMETVEAAKPEGVKPTSSLINSVTELARIKRFVPDEKWDANPDVLVCQNGALHIPTRELLAHSPHHYVTSALPYNYDKNAYPAVWHVFLKTTVPAVADFLQEYAGYCLTIGTSHELAVWLAGPPGCGKSTFIAGLEAMLGHRVGVLGLAELERNRFALAKLKGKTLMTATEKPTNYLASEGGILNAIISGESLQVERKYQDPYDLTPHAKILWAMNELPRVADASSGLFRRVRVVKFPRLDEADRNPDIKDCIKREGAGILNWALTGLDRLSKRGGFEVPKAVEDATADFRESNDVPALFVAERCVKDPAESVTGASLYTEYKYWCEDNGHRPQSSTTIAEDWQRLGFRKTRPKGVTHYNGLRVKLPSE